MGTLTAFAIAIATFAAVDAAPYTQTNFQGRQKRLEEPGAEMDMQRMMFAAQGLEPKICNELGWSINAGRFGNNTEVCGESILNGVCYNSNTANWYMAKYSCMLVGARLCSVDELQNDLAAKTGCNLDAYQVWTNDPCSTGNGYMVARGTFKQSVVPKCVSGLVDAHNIRCCADSTQSPTSVPTPSPTTTPTTPSPTTTPTTPSPTTTPTPPSPTTTPTTLPTQRFATIMPTQHPNTPTPTQEHSHLPSPRPITLVPSIQPTPNPVSASSPSPSTSPSFSSSSSLPSPSPSSQPLPSPSSRPLPQSSASPSPDPTPSPSPQPTSAPTSLPSPSPSSRRTPSQPQGPPPLPPTSAPSSLSPSLSLSLSLSPSSSSSPSPIDSSSVKTGKRPTYTYIALTLPPTRQGRAQTKEISSFTTSTNIVIVIVVCSVISIVSIIILLIKCLKCCTKREANDHKVAMIAEPVWKKDISNGAQSSVPDASIVGGNAFSLTRDFFDNAAVGAYCHNVESDTESVVNGLSIPPPPLPPLLPSPLLSPSPLPPPSLPPPQRTTSQQQQPLESTLVETIAAMETAIAEVHVKTLRHNGVNKQGN